MAEQVNDIDTRVRLRVFEWLKDQTQIYGDVLPWQLLNQGVPFEATRIRLMGPQGIFKPEILPELPLTITTSHNSPYDDSPSDAGYILYKYRKSGPDHRDNQGLRKAMARNTPLVYLVGVARGQYRPVWPVYIVGDDLATSTFKVAVDDVVVGQLKATAMYPVQEVSGEDAKRKYLTVQTRYRLHQARFRAQVLHAYNDQCAMCKLRHSRLLDATHIISDAEPKGEPIIPNGIAMCKLHHAAFDCNVLGIRPDYVIEVREDVLKEKDGPMLRHGLQELNEQKIILPHAHKHYPDPERLETRYQEFKNLVGLN